MLITLLDRLIVTSCLVGTCLLVVGAIILLWIRHPVLRIRTIQTVFLGCLCVPLFALLPGTPKLSVPIWELANRDSQESKRFASIAEHGLNGSDPVTNSSDHLLGESQHERFTKLEDVDTTRTLPSSLERTAQMNVDSGSSLLSYSMNPMFFARCMFCVCIVWMASVFCLAFLRQRYLIRRSSPACSLVQSEFESIAGDQGKNVYLRVSEFVRSPIMWGLFRPTILIPKSFVESDPNHLRFGLAHEWAHVLRMDFASLVLAQVARCACFYQPLYWWMQKQLMLSQDYLADAYAAKITNDSTEYADFLLTLARKRQPMEQLGVLCMADRKSTLLRRICMLLESSSYMHHPASRASTIGIVSFLAIIAAATSAMELSPAERNVESTAESKPEQEPTSKPLPDPITYHGQVVERETGKPIADAIVRVSHQLSHDPKTKGWLELEETEHKTDENGNYSFTLPPEQVAEPSLYLEVEVRHPSYQSPGRAGYSHTMIVKNLQQGDPPFFSNIKLYPGQKVSIRVLEPDGKPSRDTRVSAYSKAPSKKQFDFSAGGFQETTTDSDGRCEMVFATPGDGVLWVFPKSFAPQAIRIGKNRDPIEVKLADGDRIKGVVLDVKGNPLSTVGVRAERLGDGDKADDFLKTNAVANQIGAGTKTNESGEFELKPLPPGSYRINIHVEAHDPTVKSKRSYSAQQLPHVFQPYKLQLNGDPPAPIEIRALPHVLVKGRFFDAKGQPRASHEQRLYGKSEGAFVSFTSTKPGSDGWFEFRVPHGLEDATIDLTTNEHSALRSRLRSDQPYSTSRSLKFGKLEEDLTTIEVVRYEAPILLVKVVDESGNALPNSVPNLQFTTEQSRRDGGFTYGGDVNFEKQSDGRWRSSSLPPDEEFSVTAKQDGYTSEQLTMSLPEKETKEVTITLKKE